MPLRYNGKIIELCREEAGETDYSIYNGISQAVSIQALKEGLIHCANNIYKVYPHYLDVKTVIDLVNGQQEYDLPENAYLGAGIQSVRGSHDGSARNYQPLTLTDYNYEDNGATGEPTRYYLRGERTLLVTPIPDSSNGKLAINHAQWPDLPALRVGKIASRTLNGGGTQYETIVLEDDATLDETAIASDEYLCVNDKDGNVVHYNAYYSSYDSGTKTLTLDGALASTGAISVGDYITLGKYTTTHIKLDTLAEPIIMAFLRRRYYLSKSSEDVSAENENIIAFTAELVDSFNSRVRDAKQVPYRGIYE